ncbi:MAG: hypothetical protein KH459_12240 [Oscillospiraceae bacterium]|nr:hypothetical protein [Oscillospiraceae bacterium]
MEQTRNYGLNKPGGSDYARIDVLNANMDAVDAALKELEESKAEGAALAAHEADGVKHVSAAERETLTQGFALLSDEVDTHIARTDNPHGVTAKQAGAVPTTRKVNGKALSADVTLAAGDVGAASASHSHTWAAITDKPTSFAPAAHASTHGSGGTDPVTPAAIGAAAASHKHGAGDINSGTLDAACLPTVPLTKGGTGQTTAAKALYALINGSSTLAYSGAAAGDFLPLLDTSATTGKKISLENLINYMQLLGGVPKIATGSYTGTGTYGADNPCSLTFPFLPKLVIIRETGANYSNSKWSGYFTTILIPDAGGPTIGIEGSVIIYGVNNALSQTFTDTGISWHSTRSALYQLNTANRDYGYIAIG